MPNVEFPMEFPYGFLDRNALEPVLSIRLFLADMVRDLQVLVDTGAERTLLEGIHLRALGIDLFSGRQIAFQGFLGSRMVAYEHRVRLLVAGIELEMDVAFSTQPLSRQVLGRDVMAHLILGIRERALEIYLAPEPVSPRSP